MHDDSDWLNPEREAVDVQADTERPAFTGVYRIETQGEEGVPYPSLIAATAEPPQDPEAEVRGPGGCLAQSTRHDAERCGWVFTMLGARRIEREANGIPHAVAS